MSFFKQVYEVVRQIPGGKVMTYGDVARAAGTREGKHANRDPQTPCHRVVFGDGRLTSGHAFGGGKQREKLTWKTPGY
jgi:methylated-DNA-protein-cysteine methyltransferase-like protein